MIRESLLTTVLFAFDINFVLTDCNAWGIKRILYYKINREALTVLCSVIKHLSTQELGRNTRLRLVNNVNGMAIDRQTIAEPSSILTKYFYVYKLRQNS